jgi:hypothetical protein
MMPLFASVQQRLFKDDIADNFRPYITGGIGPVMILVSPYARYHEVVGSDGSTAVEQDQVEYFTSLKYAQVRYTFGGYIGAGVYFGSQGGPLSGISFRYIYIPYPPGIDVMESGYGYTYKPMKTFGGFFITLTFGTFL